MFPNIVELILAPLLSFALIQGDWRRIELYFTGERTTINGLDYRKIFELNIKQQIQINKFKKG
jgi:hypothetical protein